MKGILNWHGEAAVPINIAGNSVVKHMHDNKTHAPNNPQLVRDKSGEKLAVV